jgi:hypothetical protein
VDGKSDWLISIMKDFDWLQVHINNSFKNSSVKATIIKVKRMYQIPLSNFFSLICFMAKNKSNKQYFETALSKSLTNFGHTTLKEQQNQSCIRKLVVDSQGFCKSLIFNIYLFNPTGVVF